MASACDYFMPLCIKELCNFWGKPFSNLVGQFLSLILFLNRIPNSILILFFLSIIFLYKYKYKYFRFLENIHVIINQKLLFATQPKSICENPSAGFLHRA